MVTETTHTIHFKGVNALRFFAAFAVVITHIEMIKPSFYFQTYWHDPLIFELGSLGVYFFFVLSGFLITFLLLVEKEKHGLISVRKFYIRRILRIWPLYYFVLLLGFFVLPLFPELNINYLQNSFENNFNSNLILYLLILPNVALSIFPSVPHIGQLWSIGVEEQFYLLWPLLINLSKKISKSLFIVLFSIVMIKFAYLASSRFVSDTTWYKPVKLFLAMSKFECMAIGSIGAYLLFRKHEKFMKFIVNPYLFVIMLIMLPTLIYFTPQAIQDGAHILYAIIFLTMIIKTTQNRFLGSILDNKVFNYLGKISYGIYMYHFMIIPIVLVITRSYIGTQNDIFTNILIYSSVTLLTIFISGVSFELMEKRFIRLKDKFAVIRSKF
jgi:peptidoglycan/LPS O-acetylase OafA/YrhL